MLHEFRFMAFANAALLMAICALPLAFWTRSISKVGIISALFGSFATNISVAWWYTNASNATRRFSRFEHSSNDSSDAQSLLIVICACVAANLGIALLVKVYRAAVLDKATPEERVPGVPGVRAWLTPANMIAVILLAITSAEAFNWNYVVVALAGFCVLLAYPLIGSALRPTASMSEPVQAPPQERQRVLALVEAGRITSQEGAELLNALAHSQAAGGEVPAAISNWRRIMLVGGGLLLVAFFLPWFAMNATQAFHDAMHDAMNEVQSAMPHVNGASPPISFGSVPVPVTTTTTLVLRGGDMPDGLGWIALATGLLAALLPFGWNSGHADPRLMRNITFPLLGVGAVALLYLLSNSFNAVTNIQPGFALALVGYLLLSIGAIREFVIFYPSVRSAPLAS